MYKVFADNLCIYDDMAQSPSEVLISPKLSLADNVAGSFSMTLSPNNSGYKTINRMTTDILITKNGIDYWTGRVLNEKIDFWNNKTFTCEGALAYLNDSVQPPASYYHTTIRAYLSDLLQNHNNAVTNPNRKIKLGRVTVTTGEGVDNYDGNTNYESTMECIDKIIETYGGHMFIRIESDGLYLDYLKSYNHTNAQTIEFGKNLLDFVRNWDTTDLVTVVIPLGAKIRNEDPNVLDSYVTIESINNGEIRVFDPDSEAYKTYGRIEKTVKFDKIEDPAILYLMARLYLQDMQFDDMSLEVKAIDLKYTDANYESIDLNDGVHVISKPHGLDRWFPVQKLDIPLDQPENTVFSLNYDPRKSYTQISYGDNSGLAKKIEDVDDGLNNKINNVNKDLNDKITNFKPDIPIDDILKSASENANQLINNATNGYITITKTDTGNGEKTQELFVTNIANVDEATECWRWNIAGLAHGTRTKDETGVFTPWAYNVAMTMDGSINADFINTGTLNANLITAGTMSANRISGGTISADLIRGGIIESPKKTLSIDLDNARIKVAFDKNNDESPEFKLDTGSMFLGQLHNHAYESSLRLSDPRSIPNGQMWLDNKSLEFIMGDDGFNGFYHWFHLRTSHYLDTQGGYNREYGGFRVFASSQYGDGTLLDGNNIVDISQGKANFYSFQVLFTGPTYVNGDTTYSSICEVEVDGNFSVRHGKHRIVTTDNYGEKLLYCYESTSPMFGDVGSGMIGSDGLAYIQMDPVFREVIDKDLLYQVFLQKYGDGDLYVLKREKTYFVVSGTPNLKFGWEIKGKQRDYNMTRLETYKFNSNENLTKSGTNPGSEAKKHIEKINNDRLPDMEMIESGDI